MRCGVVGGNDGGVDRNPLTAHDNVCDLRKLRQPLEILVRLFVLPITMYTETTLPLTTAEGRHWNRVN